MAARNWAALLPPAAMMSAVAMDPEPSRIDAVGVDEADVASIANRNSPRAQSDAAHTLPTIGAGPGASTHRFALCEARLMVSRTTWNCGLFTSTMET